MSSISTQARGIQRPCWLPGKRLWYVLAPQRATPPDIHNAMFSPAIRTSHKLGSVVHLHQTTWLRRSKRLSASTCARRWRYEIKFTYWHMGCNSDTKSRTLSTAWLHTRLRQDCGPGASFNMLQQRNTPTSWHALPISNYHYAQPAPRLGLLKLPTAACLELRFVA